MGRWQGRHRGGDVFIHQVKELCLRRCGLSAASCSRGESILLSVAFDLKSPWVGSGTGSSSQGPEHGAQRVKELRNRAPDSEAQLREIYSDGKRRRPGHGRRPCRSRVAMVAMVSRRIRSAATSGLERRATMASGVVPVRRHRRIWCAVLLSTWATPARGSRMRRHSPASTSCALVFLADTWPRER